MYQTLLLLHSWLRWFVLGAGLLAVLRAYLGWTGRRPFTKGDNGISAAFSGFMWLQVIIGLGLYFGLSPWGLNAMKQPGAMKDPTARFFGMEHIAVMVLAAILAQVGRIALKRAPSDTMKHKKAFTYFAIALVLVLLMIPWGIWNPARPLFRF
ncbi:hypothetical protein GCM10023172_32200 [Hymenobacter ginsengisoli]|uniref:Cytochrome B n=1 Tax=Hymenobacter ginsengisoli TaxID=1051626 RepID=A0ABP8QKF6_9BACT|nr:MULTISPECIES: hypothetical protein [unclassified Hymenobacter]MBO2031241.1 hypothetical protein [Hymenobacter sp. BT559]